MLKLTLLAFVLFSTCSVLQATPIPTRPEGYSRGATKPTLHLEAYYDLLCPGSKSAWNLLEPILRDTYHIDNNQTLKFTIHLYPLPYHIHAFTVHQGAHVIASNQANKSDVFTYMDLLFANQGKFDTSATINQSQQQVNANLAATILPKLPNATLYFLPGLSYGNNYDAATRVSWKYGASNRVHGTPTFFANGVEINGAYAFSWKDWQRFIDGGYVQYLGLGRSGRMEQIDL